MSKEDTGRAIRSRKSSARSIDEQVEISHAMWENDILPEHDGIKANDIEDRLSLELEFTVRTSLSHLEEIDIVEEFIPPGPETLVIAEWMNGGEGKVVLGEVEEAAVEGLEALHSDLEPTSSESGAATAADGSGVTIRSTVASEFDLVPEKVGEYLRTTDKPVKVLNRAVDAINEEEGIETSDDYGKIAFINMPYRYRLTEWAVELYEA